MRAGESGHVKIGWTKDDRTLRSRKNTLQIGQPFKLSVIRTIDAPRWAEAWLHGFFSGVQASGEWFEYQETMMTLEIPDDDPGHSRMTRTNAIHVRVSDETMDNLVRWSSTDRRSIANLARYILEEAIVNHRAEKSDEPRPQG